MFLTIYCSDFSIITTTTANNSLTTSTIAFNTFADSFSTNLFLNGDPVSTYGGTYEMKRGESMSCWPWYFLFRVSRHLFQLTSSSCSAWLMFVPVNGTASISTSITTASITSTTYTTNSSTIFSTTASGEISASLFLTGDPAEKW